MTNEENAIHNEWGLFEHHLRLLPLYDLHKDFDQEDYRMYDDPKTGNHCVCHEGQIL